VVTTTQAPTTRQHSEHKQGRGDFLKRHWSILAPVLALVVMIIGFTIMSAQFLTVGNAKNIMLDSSVLLVLALASTTIILMGSIDLSIGSTLAFCAFVGALVSRDVTSNYPLLLLPVIGLACGLVNGLGVAFLRLPSFLMTLGTFFIYNGLANYFANGQPVLLAPGAPLNWFSGDLAGFPIIAIWALGVLLVVFLVMRYTRFGRYIFAIGGNEKTARLSGVSVQRVKVYAFSLAGALAGLAALLQLAKLQSASPDMGAPFMLPAIAAVVMGGTPLTGGVGGPIRSLLGVLVIAILANGMVLGAVNPHLQNVIQGLVVIAAVAVTMNRRRSEVVK